MVNSVIKKVDTHIFDLGGFETGPYSHIHYFHLTSGSFILQDSLITEIGVTAKPGKNNFSMALRGHLGGSEGPSA